MAVKCGSSFYCWGLERCVQLCRPLVAQRCCDVSLLILAL